MGPSQGNEAADLVDRLVEEGRGWRSVLVVGPPDSGKTTVVEGLASRLAGAVGEEAVARLDLDPGQSTVGPPATVGLTRATQDEGEEPTPLALAFVGSTSPSGHFLQLVVGAGRLLERARAAKVSCLVVDPPGYYRAGGGGELHYRMAETVAPDHLVALQREGEVEPLLANFDGREGTEVHRLEAPPEVRERSRAERRANRRRRFRRHFRDAGLREVDLEEVGLHGHVPELDDAEATRDRLLGLCGRDGFLLALGRLVEADPAAGRLEVWAPPFESRELTAVAFGTLRMDDEETGEPG